MNAAQGPGIGRTARSGKSWSQPPRRGWPEARLRAVVAVLGLVLTIALSLRFGLAGSATGVQSAGGATTPACPESSQPPPAATPAGAPYQTMIHVFTVRGNPKFDSGGHLLNGVLWKVTVSVGPWLPGSDQPALEDAWQTVSEKKSAMPLGGGAHKQLGNRTVPVRKCLDSRRAAYLFGTVEFEDMTTYGDAVTERVGNPFILALPEACDPDCPPVNGRVSEYVFQLQSTSSIQPNIDLTYSRSVYIPTQTGWEQP